MLHNVVDCGYGMDGVTSDEVVISSNASVFTFVAYKQLACLCLMNTREKRRRRQNCCCPGRTATNMVCREQDGSENQASLVSQ